MEIYFKLSPAPGLGPTYSSAASWGSGQIHLAAAAHVVMFTPS